MKSETSEYESLIADFEAGKKPALEVLAGILASDPEKIALQLLLMAIEKRAITFDQAAHIAAATDADPQSVCEVLATILEKHGLMSPKTVQEILGGETN